jgi:two-component system, sensor histidine kinase and response regulator
MEETQDRPSDSRVLIVDDHPENLLAIESVLADLPVTLVRATSGEEALSLLLDGDYALVLLDVQMPLMDGYEVATLMGQREETRHIPVVFVTAIDREGQRTFQGYESGAVDFLYKPIDPVILESKVRIFVDLYEQRRQIQQQLDEIKALRLLLPICCYCKSVRDDEGYWSTIEHYFHQNTRIDFSHGMCPVCLEEHYPEVAKNMK